MRNIYSLGRKIKINKSAYFMIAPFFIAFFVFTLLPVVISIFYSFTNYDMLQPAKFAGFQNYITLFVQDDIFLIALKNTLLFAAITGPVCYLFSFFMAWLINDMGRRLRVLLTTIFYAPAISGQAYIAWLFLFSPDSYGILNALLIKYGFISQPIAWFQDARYSFTILIVVQIWMSLGTSFLAFIAGLQGVNRELYEAGMVDGVRNRFQELWFITLPAMQPQLLFGAVMQIIGSFAVGEISIRLCGFPSVDYASETLVTRIMDFGTIRYEMGYACAIAAILFLLMILTKTIVTEFLKRLGK